MSKLGQFYTRSAFSDLLVSNIDLDTPSMVLELGAGQGSLLKSAVSRWINASFIATEIDSKNIAHLNKALPKVDIYKVNSLKSNINLKINIKVGSMDVAICNPPYLKVKKNAFFNELFDDTNLKDCNKLSILTSDLVFLAQNLRLLKDGGQMGIIVPDTLITGKEFKLFRKNLMESYNVSKIIELPERIFPKTDAQTHILIIEKAEAYSERIEIFKSDVNGNCIDNISIQKGRLVQRMDFKFHSHFPQTHSNKTKVLSTLNAIIERGTPSYKEVRETGQSYIHTTNFPDKVSNLILGKVPKKYKAKYKIARSGDILLARVGRNCIGKACLIEKGEAILSDCVYRIQVPENKRMKVYRHLISIEGQNWFKAMSHGVCAKVISKSDLLNFPIK